MIHAEAGNRAAMSTTATPLGRGHGPRPFETDDVTIVVATHNRPGRLAETVPRHRAPLIVVDNASDQPIRLLGADVIRLPANIGAAARNAGVEHARTPFVAFADDDSYWEPGSLARAAALMRAHPRVALLAAEVRVGPQRRLDPVSAAMAAAPLGTTPGGPGPAVLGFLSCSVVVRREAFRTAGGFQPRLFVYGEEALLAMDLAAAGHQLCYVPALGVRHLPEPAGRAPRTRRRLEARNRLLTALLRRPPAIVARTAAATLREEPTALAGALRHLPWAMGHRRRLPPSVEEGLRLLAQPDPRSANAN
ncbi:glycosyltransferase [Actinoplanes sp. KI2]|uniref:glycosyltransferase family 2 protein n=1 Tax=Actinoplanes sp. KI2 TaxID=2983315 RepID=UPI0021D59924|nr:glycosyltransferase [Actinoplanes sp. KI2]MCU7723862.1 glycosyltransferase [Actinoplanes sp. KI2]